LAGQGLNLGLGDVECLSRVVHNALLRGGDIGLCFIFYCILLLNFMN
jgi:2-polyprenyl-6-methoxyphenol hydroxylase-like FAD-dependent oxidoreductase